MTLFWKTRGRTGRDFKHLLVHAAFLGQLAKKKLHSLQRMLCVFASFSLSSLKVELAFWENLGWGAER